MRLEELAREYRQQAQILRARVLELKAQLRGLEDRERRMQIALRIRTLEEMIRDVRDVAVLLERYYERGYRRNGRYTL